MTRVIPFCSTTPTSAPPSHNEIQLVVGHMFDLEKAIGELKSGPPHTCMALPVSWRIMHHVPVNEALGLIRLPRCNIGYSKY